MYQLSCCLLSNAQEGSSVDPNWKKSYDSEGPQYQDGQVEAKRKQDGSKVLPFEFVALEACLEAACNALENEVYYILFFYYTKNVTYM